MFLDYQKADSQCYKFTDFDLNANPDAQIKHN